MDLTAANKNKTRPPTPYFFCGVVGRFAYIKRPPLWDPYLPFTGHYIFCYVATLLPSNRMLHMPVVKIEPSDEYPVPYHTGDEELDNFADRLASVANTADLLEELGAPVEATKGTLSEEAALIDKAISQQSIAPLKSSLPAAVGVSAFLKAYGQSRAFDVDQIRAALTNKLLEIADCGEVKYELKAIELLGKHSDIGLFTERSEININYNNPESLEEAIKERVKRLLNADVIDIKPLGMDLDEELGISDVDFTDEEEQGE